MKEENTNNQGSEIMKDIDHFEEKRKKRRKWKRMKTKEKKIDELGEWL